ncbi:hypothetical protein N2152v2_004831 [Parachlorella kessleri]
MAQAAGRVARWLADQVFKAVANIGETADSEEDDGVYLQCGKLVFDNVPPNLRTELWLSQLHRGSGTGAAAAAQYNALVTQGKLNQEVFAEIEKDAHRTFPGHPRLSSPEGNQAMLGVLSAYGAIDPDIGYCQGMNFLVGLLLAFLPRAADAFGALVLLMHERRLRDLYKPDMSLLQVRLWQLGKLLPDQLATHLESHAVLPVLYASSWFLTCFASDFPIQFAARVLDVVLTDCYAAPMMKVAVGILEQCSELLLEMQDMELILQHIKQDVPKWPKPVLQELLTRALTKPWSGEQLKVLNEMNGAETVVEAVARVNQLTHARALSRLSSPEAGVEPVLTGPAGSSLTEPSMSSAASAAAAAGVAGAASRVHSMTSARTLSVLSPAPTLGALAGASFTAPLAEPWMGPASLTARLSKPSPAVGTAAAPLPQPPGQAGEENSSSGAEGSTGTLQPLPPPPASRGEAVAWKAWGPSIALDAVPPEQLRIETEIGGHVELAPSLTQALSTFRPLDVGAPLAAAALATAADSAASEPTGPLKSSVAAASGKAVPSPRLESAGAAGSSLPASVAALQSPAPQRIPTRGSSMEQRGSDASLPIWQLTSLSPTCSLPSPFDSSPSGYSSGGASRGRASPVRRAPSNASLSERAVSSLDEFGSFQNARSASGPPQAARARSSSGPPPANYAEPLSPQKQQQMQRQPQEQQAKRPPTDGWQVAVQQTAGVGRPEGGLVSSVGKPAREPSARSNGATEAAVPATGRATLCKVQQQPAATGALLTTPAEPLSATAPGVACTPSSNGRSLAEVLRLLSIGDGSEGPAQGLHAAMGKAQASPEADGTPGAAPKQPQQRGAFDADRQNSSWESASRGKQAAASAPRHSQSVPEGIPAPAGPPDHAISLARSASHPSRDACSSQPAQPGSQLPHSGSSGRVGRAQELASPRMAWPRSQSDDREARRSPQAMRQMQEDLVEGFLLSTTPKGPAPRMRDMRSASPRG